DGEQLGFDAAAAEDSEAAFGFFPGGVGGRREGDFEKQAAVFFVKGGSERGGVGACAFGSGLQQSGEDFFGFEAAVEIAGEDGSREFFAEVVGFKKHLDEAALGGLGTGADQLGA